MIPAADAGDELAARDRTRLPSKSLLQLGDAERALLLSQHLLEMGVYAPAIRPPTVPDSTSRIRVTVTADHTTEQLDEALAAFERAGRAARVI